jgi:hypothetical protein
LLCIARAMFPHAGLSDGPYIRAVSALVHSSSLGDLQTLSAGLREFRLEGAGPIASRTQEEIETALRRSEAGAFFLLIRQSISWTLYDDREVWRFIGYPGASFQLGGYLNRGFNDLDWLPEPRIEESKKRLTEVVHPSAKENLL